jgi:hypothetical protein
MAKRLNQPEVGGWFEAFDVMIGYDRFTTTMTPAAIKHFTTSPGMKGSDPVNAAPNVISAAKATHGTPIAYSITTPPAKQIARAIT